MKRCGDLANVRRHPSPQKAYSRSPSSIVSPVSRCSLTSTIMPQTGSSIFTLRGYLAGEPHLAPEPLPIGGADREEHVRRQLDDTDREQDGARPPRRARRVRDRKTGERNELRDDRARR